MAIVSCGPVLYPDPNRLHAWTSFTPSAPLTATGGRVAWVFPVPQSGTITKVAVRVNTVTTSATCRIGLYTLDASGQPTSTGYGGSAYGTFTPVASTYHEVTLATAATATQGDLVGLVVEWDSTAGSIALSTQGSNNIVPFGLPYYISYNGTTWSKSTQLWPGHIFYQDGTYQDSGQAPIVSSTTGTINVNTAGADEYGNRLTLPFRARVKGLWSLYTMAAGADYEAILYSGTTVLGSVALDGDAVGSGPLRYHMFASPVTVASGTLIRCAIRPTTTNNVTWRRFVLTAQAAAQALGLPTDAAETTRVDQGSWTDSTGGNLQGIGLILDGLDDGVGGLFLPRGMNGGYSA